MDPRVAWLMPEQQGPAAQMYQELLKNCDRKAAEAKNEQMQNNGQAVFPGVVHNGQHMVHVPPKKGPIHIYTEEERIELNEQKAKLLELNQILEPSPIANSCDNPAATSNTVQDQLKVHTQYTRPWVKQRQSKVGVYNLHQEIIDFYKWINATEEEYQMRFEVVLRVENLIKQEFPGASVEVFGSFQTGLYLPTSDIDMVVIYDETQFTDPALGGSAAYYRLQDRLIKNNVAEKMSIKVIPNAAVPIVKMRDVLTDIKVDISFNMTSGVDSVSLIKEFMREFPALPYLVLLLKQFLLQRDMNEVWTGGISSYGLILMTISFLQKHKRGEGRNPNVNLGVLLIEFFELYGRQFNYEKEILSYAKGILISKQLCIRVKNGGEYIQKEEMAEQMKRADGGAIGKYYPNYLSIEDPLTPSNDIGRASHGAETVKEAFNYAYRVLTRAVSPQSENYPVDCKYSILDRIIMITDEVYKYRSWVKRYWSTRVPRMIVYPDKPTQIPPAEKTPSVNSGSSPEGSSESESEKTASKEPDTESDDTYPSKRYQNTHLPLNTNEPTEEDVELRAFSDNSDNSGQSPQWTQKPESPVDHKQRRTTPNISVVISNPNHGSHGRDNNRQSARIIKNTRQAQHSRNRSNEFNNEEHIDSNRPTKSSQSDSNSNHENNQFIESNPKSPSSSMSPNKRVNRENVLFQMALKSATRAAGSVSAVPGSERRKGSERQNRPESDHPRRNRDRKTKNFYEGDFDERRSQRSRRSSDSRGSPIPEGERPEDYPHRRQRSYGNNRRDDNPSPHMAGQPRFSNRRYHEGGNGGGHISPQGVYNDHRNRAQGAAMDQPMSYRNEGDRNFEYEPRRDFRDREKKKRGDRALYSTKRGNQRGEGYGRSSGGDRDLNQLNDRNGSYMDGESSRPGDQPETRRLDLGRRSNEGLTRERREMANASRAARNGRDSFSPIPPLNDSHRTTR